MAAARIDVRLANDAWEAVLTAHTRLTALFADANVFTEVSMREYDVLYTLAKHGDPMRLSELRSRVLLSQPALSRLVDRLIQRGLLNRCTDDEDRRAVRIWLTKQGQDIQRRIGRVHAKSVAQEIGSALTPEEIHELRRIATKLAAAI